MSMRSSGGRLGRFVFLPFSIRCDSESSVALAVNSISPPKQSNTPGEKSGEENLKMNKNQNISKATLISQGLHRLVRRFKSFSQFFVYKEEEMEKEMEKEMEIGYPTDVKHVTHIGSDGSTTINNNPLSTNWKPTHDHQLLSFPSLSLHQFELAMAAQSHPPILPPST